MYTSFRLLDLELIMKRALITGLLVGAAVFMAGIIYDWTYALLLAFLILICLNLAEMARRK